MKKHTHKLTKTSSHSYFIIIPKEIVEKYGWREKQKMTIVDKGRGKVELRDWRK
ncbi:AbrB/MazE/SpoVT family DNA-binding domain-containing protein [bacterium]|nr:MAG: AbrB/MazE/SpoVT family DNA-binding domain-containing protein [bacterium]